MKPTNRHKLPQELDPVQQRLVEYAQHFTYDRLPLEAVYAAKLRFIDTIASLMGGLSATACRIARRMAATIDRGNATVIGTRTKTTPDMAAYANATAARYIELNDTYHWPGAIGGHPSDVIMPLLAAAESANSSGRDLIAAIVLAYEVFLRISDEFPHEDFCQTNFGCIATAAATAKLWNLDSRSMGNCISIAAVSSNILNQVRKGHLSMWKAVASGHAGRAAVFAAMLAKAGMEGPQLPFVGKAGWCDQIARRPLALSNMGGLETPFKIGASVIKCRPSCGTTISSILAAEKIAPIEPSETSRIVVEVYQTAKDMVGTGEHHWNPQTRETADHSIPYVVAATLISGTITIRSFDDAQLWNPEVRALMSKIEVVSNPGFTAAYAKTPCEHRTRITAYLRNGDPLVGETGGKDDDLAAPMTIEQINEKFRSLTADFMNPQEMNTVLDCLWNLETLSNTAVIPAYFSNTQCPP